MIIDMPTVSMGNGGSILPAEKVSYDNTTSGLEAENVQDAVDEVSSNLVPDYQEEKCIGTWGNKLLYRNYGTLNVANVTPANNKLDVSAWNIDEIISMKATFKRNNSITVLGIPHVNGDEIIGIYAESSSTGGSVGGVIDTIFMSTNKLYNVGTAYVEVVYTKRT